MAEDQAPITQYFSERPYNFDAPPPQYLIGPIKSLLAAIGERFTQVQADVQALSVQVSVQSATGVYLDLHGVLYGVQRATGELDDPYRARILDALVTLGITIPSLQKIARAYMANLHPNAPPPIKIYDLQSNPSACAADASNGFPIEVFDFVVQMTSSVLEDDIAFLDYTAFLDRGAYMFRLGTVYDWGNSGLLALMNRKKAANTNPVMKSIVSVVLDNQTHIPATGTVRAHGAHTLAAVGQVAGIGTPSLPAHGAVAGAMPGPL